MTVREYKILGMPDIDTLWSTKYLYKAYSTLARIRSRNFFSLPRNKSRKSGAVFSQIINRDNLYFLYDSTMTLREKAFQIQSLSGFLNDMTRIYGDELRVKQYYSEELVDLYTFNLYVRKKMFELASEIDKSDKPEDIGMKPGRGVVVTGYVMLVGSIVNEQEKTESYSTAELKRLSKAVVHSIKENIQYLDVENKKKIVADLNRSIERHPSGYVPKEYKKVLKLINN
jgi:hypothetical protein